MSPRDAEDQEFAELTLKSAEIYLNEFMRLLWRSANTARKDLREGYMTEDDYDLRVWRVRDFEIAMASFRHGRFHHVLCYIEDRMAELDTFLKGDLPEPSRPFVRSEHTRATIWHRYLSSYI